MGTEALEQMSALKLRPTHAFLPIGVGGLAAGLVAPLWCVYTGVGTLVWHRGQGSGSERWRDGGAEGQMDRRDRGTAGSERQRERGAE